MKTQFDPKHAEAHGYTRADWDAVETPEATDEELAQSQPFAAAFPEMAKKFEAEIARRGRPPLDNPKVPVSIRLDRDLVDRLKADGKGWQSRANVLLRDALGI